MKVAIFESKMMTTMLRDDPSSSSITAPFLQLYYCVSISVSDLNPGPLEKKKKNHKLNPQEFGIHLMVTLVAASDLNHTVPSESR